MKSPTPSIPNVWRDSVYIWPAIGNRHLKEPTEQQLEEDEELWRNVPRHIRGRR
ncbi:hypothetical protein BGZ47_002124, partial [Haplosporangium gracile]